MDNTEQHNYKKKLYIKAKRRGMIELDLVIGYIADYYLNNMTAEELNLFAEFLALDDNIIYKWLNKQEAIPEHFLPIWNMAKSYKPTL